MGIQVPRRFSLPIFALGDAALILLHRTKSKMRHLPCLWDVRIQVSAAHPQKVVCRLLEQAGDVQPAPGDFSHWFFSEMARSMLQIHPQQVQHEQVQTLLLEMQLLRTSNACLLAGRQASVHVGMK
eukprot:CAMPEP_0169384376 /NCGR_PEP_ID=MMETSP1017-20121227/43389_2 /TAXON_ID=342587 /ORGANISM="Karlodinium micrum, Strain CCMP2283" /LENGTH=125 /DNA_ID=CAMNT_0009484919 /DNA_START=115 /DNA_END=492 /DNA_ORIENTATION=-